MKKYTLNDNHREFLRTRRNENGFTAEEVSEKLNHHKSWLGQVERGRLAGIKKDDLDKLLSLLYNIPLSEIIEHDFSDSFYTNNFDVIQPEKTEKSFTQKIEFGIESVIPKKYNPTSRYVKTRMKQISDIFSADQLTGTNQLMYTYMGVDQLYNNAIANSNYTLLFLTLRYDLLFEKYKDHPEVILGLYDEMKNCIDSKLKDVNSDNDQ